MGSEKLLCLLLLLSTWDESAGLAPAPLPEAKNKCVYQALPSEVVDRLLSESNATLSRLEVLQSLSMRGEEAHGTTSCQDSPSLNSFSKLLLLFLDKVEKEQDRLGKEVTALKEALRESQQTSPPDSHCTQETQQASSSTEALLTAVLQLQQDVRSLRLQSGGPNGQHVVTTQPHHHGGSCYQFSDKPRDCNELALQGKNESGVYVIYPYKCHHKDEGVRVWCDMESEDGGGGWTVVLSRRPLEGEQVNFNRGWWDYKIGFGDPETEQWIGNKVLHEMTSNAKQTLRVSMVDWDGGQRYAEYHTFFVEDEIGEYRLHLGGFGGDAGDAFSYHSNMRFTTSDRDNDLHESNCAQLFDGGFWYNKCHQVSATSNLLEKQKSTKGINWNTWYADRTTLKEMYFKVKTEPCNKID